MKKLLLIAALLLSSQAQALDLKYEASWNGLKAGSAQVLLNESDTMYSSRVRAEADGLVKKFNPYWTDSKVEGTVAKEEYKPTTYDMNFKPKKSQTQRVLVSYSKDGSVNEVATPAEKRGKRPEVPPKEKHGLPDPITAALMAREKVREMVKSGTQFPQNFAIRIFDSRRVTDLNFKVVGYKQVNINGPKKLLQVDFDRSPVTGYNKRELEKMKEVNPLINIFVNDDMIPVYAKGQSVIGEIEVKLVSK